MSELFSKEAILLYKTVWENLQEGKTLSGDLAMIAEAMKEHPEFSPFWGMGEAAFQPHEIDGYVVNPLVHIGLHVTIEKQILIDDPMEVAVAIKNLLAKAMPRHEAVHQVAGIWGNLYFRSVRRGDPFEEWVYVHELMALAGNG